ncbi:MAG: class I SAM-dependent methyltransferase [Lunatimonas sp.]|nr:class I SAM-dependent methyltransferase [Lunatimonas sp.]
MYERLTKCPLCKSGLFLNYMVVKDHAISKESFTLCKCTDCGLIFTNPRPEQKYIHTYYESEDYISHTNQSKNLIHILYKAVRRYTIRQKINWINTRVKKKGRLLDYGCGTGYLLAAAQKNGWQVIGYEPNPTACKQAKNINGLTPVTSLTTLKKEKKFDAITLFHVLEHIHDLNKTLKIILDLLKKRGFLFIAVPNLDSVDFKKHQENWAALDVPRHLYHFTNEAMNRLADKYGLKIIEKKPLIFDAYYVSLLTDKYMGQNNPIVSFLNGYRYNQQATKQPNTHSSLLYIIKKK